MDERMTQNNEEVEVDLGRLLQAVWRRIWLVVRQHYCQRPALSAANRQFAFVDGRILGVVYNGTNDDSNRYGYYKRYYRKQYGRYGRKYEGSYLNKQPAKATEKGNE